MSNHINHQISNPMKQNYKAIFMEAEEVLDIKYLSKFNFKN